MNEARTYLGFDYGRARIGVATGQTTTRSASALTTLACIQNKPDWPAIERLIEQWKPDALVVGVPYYTDGKPHEMTAAAQRFARQLEGRFGLPVHEADERLSSREAYADLVAQRQSGRKRKLAREEIDRKAAEILLRDWLNQES